MMTLVEKIQMLCRNKGITLMGLERELGLSTSTVRRWDTMRPSADKVLKVAQYFHVSTDYLLGNDNIDDLIGLAPEDMMLLKRIKTELSPGEQSIIRSVALTVLDTATKEKCIQNVTGDKKDKTIK